MKNAGIIILLLLKLLCVYGDGEECASDKKCRCYYTDEYEFQCPQNNYKMLIHASKNNKYITIDCNNLLEYDINIFPNYNAGEKEYFRMRFCPLPKDNFQSTLRALNISNIKTLRLEQNTIPTESPKVFSKELFQGLSSLETLYIDLLNTTLEDDAFEDLSNLTHLYLERSNVSDLGYMFNNNLKLKALHLTRNELTDLPDGLFSNLSHLLQLHLWGNKLTQVRKNYFTGLTELKSLELSSNNIQVIESDCFSELTNLVNISLRINKLHTLSPDIFKYNTRLEGIRIGNNPNLILPDYIFSNLPNIKIINMESSHLNNIPQHLFVGSHNLTNLIMTNNNITTLPEDLFMPTRKLIKLDLSKNKITGLPDNIFSSLEQLEGLYLQENALISINEKLFESLEHLKYLNLNRNRIAIINLRAFVNQKKLNTLDLSFNLYNMSYVPYLEGLSPFTPIQTLEHIHLRNNLLTEFPESIIFGQVKLKDLDLSYNRIKFLEASSLIKVSPYSVKVDLSHNNISAIEFGNMKTVANYNIQQADALHNNSTATQVDVSFNPFVCDCRNFDFVQYIQGKLEPLSIRTMVNILTDNKNILCSKPKSFLNISVGELNVQKIICDYRGHNCPTGCHCAKRSYDNFVIVDCSYKNLTVFPKINFSNEDIKHIELNLEGNMFMDGPTNMSGYDNVINMFLSNNQLQNLEWIPPNIEILTLHENQLNGIDSNVLTVLNKSRTLKKLTLFNNPWKCDCSALELQNFIKTNYNKVGGNEVVCKDNVALIYKKEICKSNILIAMKIVLPILVFLFLSAAAIAIYFNYKQEIKVWLYAKNICLWFVTEEELDKDKIYDVFISFSHKDEEFVMQNLLPVLESGPNPYKTCIHIRDWPGGEFITTQIANSVMNSRRTLVVLSDSFLESVWGILEFRTAHTQAIEEGRARVIVVKYGDLDEDKLDEDLRAYLKTNTYVEWGKPWFWNKLKYALPHSRQQNFYANNQKHANIMLKIDDKFELTSQPIIHPESTPPVISLDPALLKHHPLNFNSINCHTPPAEAPLISR